MCRRIAVAGLAVLAIAIPTSPNAQGGPAQADLAAGISQTRSGDFLNGLVTLNELVGRLAGRADETTTLARAHAYRAVALMGLGQPEWAKAAAVQALNADPKIIVDANEFGATVVALFEGARAAGRDPEAVGLAAEAAGRSQDAFLAYLVALQALPEPAPPADDERLRKRIIGVVRKLEPKPAVPEKAITLLARADALLAADVVAGVPDTAASQAAAGLREAVRIAPWWPDAMVQLAMALQRSGRIEEALVNLRLYEFTGSDGVEAAERETPDAAIAPAVIHVYYPKAARALGMGSKVLCDGQAVADLAPGRFITLTAAPGFHLFEFRKKNASGMFQAGMDHYIRIGIEGFPAAFALRVTERGKATQEIREKRLVANEHAKTFSTACTGVAASAKSSRH